MELQKDIPGVRPYVGIFGKRNAGKSTLFNLILGRTMSVVSGVAGTTTDPVEKSMELAGIGAVTFIDTPGYDDEGGLGDMRVEQSVKSAARCDVAIVLIDGNEDVIDRRWIEYLEGRGASVAVVHRGIGREEILDKVAALIQKRIGGGDDSILRGLVRDGGLVVLVMPQDKAAPKGRLIMPQMQTIRELLDRGCMTMCLSPQTLASGLSSLSVAPDLIITDSQAFASVRSTLAGYVPKEVPERKQFDPEDEAVISDYFSGVPLTSFSILFSRYKGDLKIFSEGASVLSGLGSDARILIAEACAHRPLSEDIGRVKLPALLRKRLGDGISIDIVAGKDWPEDLGRYDLIIHCGACMFNRQHVLNRISDAVKAGVPISNYGLVISQLTKNA